MSEVKTDLEQRYRRAVTWARVAVHELNAPLVDSGIDFRSPIAMFTRTTLIRQTDHGFFFLKMTDDALERLLRCVRVDAATYDLCADLISAGNLYDARRTLDVVLEHEYIARRALNAMPDGLRLVASLMNSGAIVRPEQRGASTNFVRDFRLVLLVHLAARVFGLTPSRGAETRPRRSACDAVLEAMRHEGMKPLSFAAMRRIWQNTRLRKHVQLYLAGERVKDREARAVREDAGQAYAMTLTDGDDQGRRPPPVRPLARAFDMLQRRQIT